MEDFLSTPVEDDRDQAGVIQAFEFTYEIFWKGFQKIAADQGTIANSPKQAIRAAYSLGLIPQEHEELWLSMLDDRNRTVHTYKKEIAQEIFEHIRDLYLDAFRAVMRKIKKSE